MSEEINFDEIFGDAEGTRDCSGNGEQPPEQGSCEEQPEDTCTADTAEQEACEEQAANIGSAEPAVQEFFTVQPGDYNEFIRRAAEQKAKRYAETDNSRENENREAAKKVMATKNEKKKGSGLMFFLFVISLSVILTCLVWMAACDVLGFNGSDTEAPVTLAKSSFTEKTVEVEDGDGNVTTEKRLVPDLNYVAQQLKDAGVIKYKWLFRLFCNFTSTADSISPGSYVLKDAYDYRALLMKMQTGSSSAITIKITFPEGYTMEQIFRTLDEQEVCDYDDLMEAAANASFNYAFLEGVEKGNASRLEGFLFPDTYEFYKYMPAASAINKFLEGYHYKLTAEMLDWQANSGCTWTEIVTVASMIEKEAANDSERYLIASVIYNRLNEGWPLQIDSTSLYEYPDHKGAPTAEMLAKDSPYNTRINTGLPPTAICSPGIVSIKAALDPSHTDYMYYALNTETGTHEFFKTAAEFEAFVATQNYDN